jgi:nitric oxide reductase large subunit
MFRASLGPSSGKQEQDWLKFHVKCALFERCCSNNSFQNVHTAYTTAPHNDSQHNQATSNEVLTSLVLVLLMMGIMMLETC